MPVKYTLTLSTQSHFSTGHQVSTENVNTKNYNAVDLAQIGFQMAFSRDD